jgi:3-methylcrotonyl-CoA carboxylase alpha subunit
LPVPSQHIRLDAGVAEGDTVTIFYDPMIAKLIVWDEDRPLALARLRQALAECEIVGPKSNIEFLEHLIRHPTIVEARIDTGYLDRHLDDVLPVSAAPDPALLAAAAVVCLLHDEAKAHAEASAGGDPYSPWAILDGWRLGHAGQRRLRFGHRGERLEVAAHGSAGNYLIDLGTQRIAATDARFEGGVLTVKIDGIAQRYRARADAAGVLIHDGEHRLSLLRLPVFQAGVVEADGHSDHILAPMPGRIVLIRACVGDEVGEGQELGVMEAMKMELSLKAPRAGVVEAVRAQVGDFVEADAVLVKLRE